MRSGTASSATTVSTIHSVASAELGPRWFVFLPRAVFLEFG